MSGMGKAIGSQIAEPLWSSAGIWANSLAGGAMTIAGVLLCFALVRETELRVKS